MKKYAFRSFLIIILLSFGIIFLFAEQKGDVANKRIREIQVTASEVYEDVVFDQVEALGVSRAKESVELMANVTEFVEEVNFSDNQFVNKGDILVRLRQYEEIVQKKSEELRLKEHERELSRLELLLKKKAVSKQLYDQRKTLLAISKQKILELDARLEDRLIKAPFSGVLGFRNIDVGSLIRPGDVITTIDNVSSILVDFTIAVKYLSLVEKGGEISAVTDAYPGQVFKGKVASVDSRANRDSSSIRMRAVIDNPELKLKPGLLFKIDLFSNKHRDILVEEDSILQSKDKHYVFVINKDNKVTKREVSIGIRQPGRVVVKSGVSVGERLVAHGIHKVKDQDLVKVIDSGIDESNLLKEGDVSF